MATLSKLVRRLVRGFLGIDDKGVVYVAKIKPSEDIGPKDPQIYIFSRRSPKTGSYETFTTRCVPGELRDSMPWKDAQYIRRYSELSKKARFEVENSLSENLADEEIIGLSHYEWSVLRSSSGEPL